MGVMLRHGPGPPLDSTDVTPHPIGQDAKDHATAQSLADNKNIFNVFWSMVHSFKLQSDMLWQWDCCELFINTEMFFLPQNQITLLHWAKHFRHSSIYDMCPYRYFLCVLVHQCPPNSNVQYLISWCGQVPPIWLADTQSSSANDYSSSKSGGGQTLNITVELHCSTVQADIIRLLGTLMYAFCNW